MRGRERIAELSGLRGRCVGGEERRRGDGCGERVRWWGVVARRAVMRAVLELSPVEEAWRRESA